MLVSLFVQTRILIPNEHRLADFAPAPMWIISCQNAEVLILSFCVLLGFAMLEDCRRFVSVSVLMGANLLSAVSLPDVIVFAG